MFGFFKSAKLKKLEVLATTRNDTGGLFKRIDENRELLEVLFREAPSFMQSHPWVEGWIKGNDAFFEGVRSTLGLELDNLHPFLANRVPRAWPQPLAAQPPRLSERAPAQPSPDWKAHAYPLQQVVIKLQGTRRSNKTAIINQLEIVRSRLQVGEAKGSEHDDDFGYSFTYHYAVDGPSFFDEPCGYEGDLYPSGKQG
ncbi:MAG: hypothetical protein ACT6S0_22310 [Roseateles sp.]|uniref:hypothetical protein n=1 Tax=Roseateles sp. TaxID=1971397 RepID=UPI004035B5AC